MNNLRSLFNGVKRVLYFPLAGYLAFWAKIVLRRWKPRIIAVTGSSGKTTMLNMLDAQIGIMSYVSHGANSAFGIPLDILGLSGIKGSRLRWIWIITIAPFRAFGVRRSERFYVAEADADRPGEARFLGKLLKPEVTIWVSSSRTHAMNFDKLAKHKGHKQVEQTIAEEFAELPKQTTDLILADGDNSNIVAALKNVEVNKILIENKKAIKEFKIGPKQTMIKLSNNKTYVFDLPQPPVIAHQVAYLDELLKYLDVEPDFGFSRFSYPPGRSSIFKGKEGYTIIDSTYNSNLDSVRAILEMYKLYPSNSKFLVLGDMLEQGKGEAAEHKKLAELVINSGIDLKQIILFGERVKKSTYPLLTQKFSDIPVSILSTGKDVAGVLSAELTPKDTVLLKGGGFLEGIVARLLADKEDEQYLARRGAHWDKRRKAKGLD